MTLQAAFNLMSLSVGFVAGAWFCIGAATNNSEQIARLAGSYIGYNLDIIRSLSAQRAQYAVGALLLVFSFGLQVAAVLTPPATEIYLPPVLQSTVAVLLSTLAIVSLLSFLGIRSITKKTATAARDHIESLLVKQRTIRKS